jgi:hypothetical protein
MGEAITVRMPVCATLGTNMHPAENKGSPFNQAVRVMTDANTKHDDLWNLESSLRIVTFGDS